MHKTHSHTHTHSLVRVPSPTHSHSKADDNSAIASRGRSASHRIASPRQRPTANGHGSGSRTPSGSTRFWGKTFCGSAFSSTFCALLVDLKIFRIWRSAAPRRVAKKKVVSLSAIAVDGDTAIVPYACRVAVGLRQIFFVVFLRVGVRSFIVASDRTSRKYSRLCENRIEPTNITSA